MRKWVANKDFLMEDIINYVTPERDYLVIRQVFAGAFIYEYENIDKVVVNRYCVHGKITDGWKKNCTFVSREEETPWGETGGTGGGGGEGGGVMDESYVGPDEPGFGENVLEDGHSRIWIDTNHDNRVLMVTRTNDVYASVELCQ